MVVIFNENNKRLELSIVGYEFPLEKGMDEFDANWLIVQFDYYEDENFSSYTDNCLLVIDHIYKVQIQFDYYRKEEWGEINIVEKMNKKELCQMKDTFKELSHQFPIRKVK